MTRHLQTPAIALIVLVCGPSTNSQEPKKPEAAAPGSVVSQLNEEANAVIPLVESDWVKAWCRNTQLLPIVDPREIELNGKKITLDEALFYIGRYGSPLAYARALDLAAMHGFDGLEKKRVLDFGYGSLGQLLMMAQSGANVVGVDVSPLIDAMYAGRYPTLQGGTVTLAHGKFPGDEKVAERVGRDFDLVISKNTLKRGYVHPAREARPGTTVDLGVDDATFLKAVHDRMNPGGLFVIYNLCPAKAAADKPYIPWADGESPFTKKQFETAGFDVLALDVEDTAAAQALGKALGWDSQMKLESDLFAWYTIVRHR